MLVNCRTDMVHSRRQKGHAMAKKDKKDSAKLPKELRTQLAADEAARKERNHLALESLMEWLVAQGIEIGIIEVIASSGNETEDNVADEDTANVVTDDEDYWAPNIDSLDFDEENITEGPGNEVYVSEVTYDAHGRPVLEGLSGGSVAVARLIRELGDTQPEHDDDIVDATVADEKPAYGPLPGWAADLRGWLEAYGRNSDRMLETLEDMIDNMSAH